MISSQSKFFFKDNFWNLMELSEMLGIPLATFAE